MKQFKITLTAVLVGLGLLTAAVTKRPGTVEVEDGQFFVDFAADSLKISENDTLKILLDTADVTGFDISKLTYEKKIPMANDRRYFPGEKFPEKICVTTRVYSEADSATGKLEVFYAETAAGTYGKAGTTVDVEAIGTGAVIANGGFPFSPQTHFQVWLAGSGTTDTLRVQAVKAFACDD